MKQFKSFLIFLLAISFVFCLGYIFFKEYIIPKRTTIQDSTIVVEKVNKILKLVTVEGKFSEIHQHTEYYGYDISPLRKKALIRVNANVLIGYDLKKIDMQIDELNKTIYIDNFPEPSLLSIDDDIEYYDVTEGLFTSFSSSDYNSLQKIAKEKIKESVSKSGLFDKAQEQKDEVLELLKITLRSLGWDLVIKSNEPVFNKN